MQKMTWILFKVMGTGSQVCVVYKRRVFLFLFHFSLSLDMGTHFGDRVTDRNICSKWTARTTNQVTDQILLSIVL